MKGIKKIKVDNRSKVKIIACEVILDEIRDRLPSGWEIVDFEKRLHEHSDRVKLLNIIHSF